MFSIMKESSKYRSFAVKYRKLRTLKSMLLQIQNIITLGKTALQQKQYSQQNFVTNKNQCRVH